MNAADSDGCAAERCGLEPGVGGGHHWTSRPGFGSGVAEVFRSRVLMEPISDPADPMQLNDLQQQVVAASSKIRAQGLPVGQP